MRTYRLQILQALLIAYNGAMACFFFSHQSVVSVASCATTLALAAATTYVCSRGYANVRNPAVTARHQYQLPLLFPPLCANFPTT